MYIQLRGIQDANCGCFSFVCLPSEGGAKGQAEPRRVSCDVGQVRPAADGSVFNEALVLWNPATSGPSYSDAPTPDPQGGLHQPAAAPQQGRDEDAGQPEDLSSQMSDECSSESPCDSHGVFRNTRCVTHHLRPKGSGSADRSHVMFLLFDSFRWKQRKQFLRQQVLTEHGGRSPEAALPAAGCAWSGHPGSDQQCGSAGAPARGPARLRKLQPAGLPGPLLVFAGSASVVSHMRSTGQASCVDGWSARSLHLC